MIQRDISNIARTLFKMYPILAITGPRQSGKTTLVKNLFPDLDYVTLEDIDTRILAKNDPRGFLSNYPNGAIFDEVQQAPDLFSYLQSAVDEKNKPSQFVLSGSQNFLLMENISQSLAGRVALLKLLPLSQSELQSAKLFFETSEDAMFTGSYPAIFNRDIPPPLFYPNYINTYIERDVRNIKNIGNIELFIRFVKLCAGRTGQPLNYSSIASDTGISINTAKSWMSILVNSYVIYLLPPHHRNFNKRLIKMPKLYFYDTGLLVSLLGIESSRQINNHFLVGGIFENYIVSELLKYFYNQSKNAPIYFWKDNKSKEIDVLIEKGESMIPIEIKASKTLNMHDFNNIQYYQKISNSESVAYVINRSNQDQKTSNGEFVSWLNLKKIFET